MARAEAEVAERAATLRDGDTIVLCVGEDDERVAVAAYDSHGNQVGIAWTCLKSTGGPAQPAMIEVTPAQRRRGIGGELLRALADAALAHGIAALSWHNPADDLAARRLASSTGAICARRTDHGQARTTVFIAGPPGTSARRYAPAA